MRPLELLGRRFSKLVVLERCDHQCNKPAWLCQCDCGKQSKVPGAALTSGNTKSCGCIVTDRISALNRTHGKSKSAEYRTWSAIKRRCYNPASKQYNDYGGRGVGMCQRWKDSFDEFLADMGSKPSPIHSIDREDVNGNYEPSNCCWATAYEQKNNARSNVRITYDCMTMTASQWARKIGVKPSTVLNRVRKGLPVEAVLHAGDLRSKGY